METDAETYERMQAPLANWDINVKYVQQDEQTLALNAPGKEYEGFDVGFVYRRSRPSASGLDPEGEGRTLS